MEERIKKLLASAYMLPAAVKDFLGEVGAELDRLRLEMDEVKTNQEKCKCK